MEKSTIEVLVENKLENQNKYFGRNKFLSSVIFDGNENYIGKLVNVKIWKRCLFKHLEILIIQK